LNLSRIAEEEAVNSIAQRSGGDEGENRRKEENIYFWAVNMNVFRNLKRDNLTHRDNLARKRD
jgi:hypothetical protein